MAYAYWKAGRIEDQAVFDLFFRKNPFHGEFTIFSGLSECLKFLENFKYSKSDIDYLRITLPSNVEEEFFQYLTDLTPNDIKIYALHEGSIAFPRFVERQIIATYSRIFSSAAELRNFAMFDKQM
jgi:nicotinate phosphoribosyltransferase